MDKGEGARVAGQVSMGGSHGICSSPPRVRPSGLLAGHRVVAVLVADHEGVGVVPAAAGAEAVVLGERCGRHGAGRRAAVDGVVDLVRQAAGATLERVVAVLVADEVQVRVVPGATAGEAGVGAEGRVGHRGRVVDGGLHHAQPVGEFAQALVGVVELLVQGHGVVVLPEVDVLLLVHEVLGVFVRLDDVGDADDGKTDERTHDEAQDDDGHHAPEGGPVVLGRLVVGGVGGWGEGLGLGGVGFAGTAGVHDAP